MVDTTVETLELHVLSPQSCHMTVEEVAVELQDVHDDKAAEELEDMGVPRNEMGTDEDAHAHQHHKEIHAW
jgi:translation initiation factor 1 (eIF-1/SUI1)